MPFSIVKKGGKYQTVTSDTGKVHGTFNSHREAEQQIKALYVNVPEARERKRQNERRRV